MRSRREEVMAQLSGPNETIICFSAFPRIGCPGFTEPILEVSNLVLLSFVCVGNVQRLMNCCDLHRFSIFKLVFKDPYIPLFCAFFPEIRNIIAIIIVI